MAGHHLFTTPSLGTIARRRSSRHPAFSLGDSDDDEPKVPTAVPVAAVAVADPRSIKLNALDVSDTIIDIEVGDNTTKTFHIHQNILTSTSEFLKSRAKPEWSPGATQVKLREHTPQAFQIYATWLYARVIPKTPRAAEVGEPVTDSEWHILAEAYVLGEYLMDDTFKDTVIDALRAKATTEGGKVFVKMPEVVATIYNGTSSGSVARKFIVDMHLKYADLADHDSIASDGPTEFFRDLSCAFMAKRSLMHDNAFKGPRSEPCAYHDHGKDRPCYLSRKTA